MKLIPPEDYQDYKDREARMAQFRSPKTKTALKRWGVYILFFLIVGIWIWTQ